MVKTASTMLPLGTPAPNFTLTNAVDGKTVKLADFAGKPLWLMFICNHCPFVKHLADDLAKTAAEYQARGVAVVAISSNDVETHPDDSPAKMKDEAGQRGYAFPYLYDPTQAVAKAYQAACTPDFYVFDAQHRLAYRGQYDASRPNSGIPITGADLRSALDAILAGQAPKADQTPSLGCNIKWRTGQEPAYFQG